MQSIRIDQVQDYTTRFGQTPLHPLITVVNLEEVDYTADGRAAQIQFNCYAVFLKGAGKIDIRYGRQRYDYQEGTLIFFAPGQTADVSSDGPDYRPSGQALLFHPDLLLRTPLAERIGGYRFFDYAVHEALHLTTRERRIAHDCFAQLRYELERDADRHSRRLMASILETFLNYCDRFYERQFATREVGHVGVVAEFERHLRRYYADELARATGPATVAHLAEQMHYSPNYLGDLIKQETGRTAQALIQDHVIALAKEKLSRPDATVSKVAYGLGFEHPQHFSRMFKRRLGVAPGAWVREVLVGKPTSGLSE